MVERRAVNVQGNVSLTLITQAQSRGVSLNAFKAEESALCSNSTKTIPAGDRESERVTIHVVFLP